MSDKGIEKAEEDKAKAGEEERKSFWTPAGIAAVLGAIATIITAIGAIIVPIIVPIIESQKTTPTSPPVSTPSPTLTPTTPLTLTPTPTTPTPTPTATLQTEDREPALPCPHDYFFEAELEACPAHAAIDTYAAEQPFENGRMIWLEQARTDETVVQARILVLYGDGRYEEYEDTWTDAEPESDPAIIPPEGSYQPVRGFGKVWRDKSGVRDGLGWATAPEQGFDTQWQSQMRENIPTVTFVRTLDGQIIQIDGWGWKTDGNWKLVTP